MIITAHIVVSGRKQVHTENGLSGKDVMRNWIKYPTIKLPDIIKNHTRVIYNIPTTDEHNAWLRVMLEAELLCARSSIYWDY